jgi:hypothetical protein
VEDESIRFRLEDGETVTVTGGDIPRIYEQLWRLAPKPGAVSTAALVRAPSTQSEFAHTVIELSAEQSAALREALEQFQAES